MKNKKLLIPTLLIFLGISIGLNAFQIYKSINDSLKIYSLEFILSKERNESKKSKMQFDRYDAMQKLRSESCFQNISFIYEVNEDAENNSLWIIKVSGYITNPDTGAINTEQLSTLGLYSFNKKTGELKNKVTNSNSICLDNKFSVEDAQEMVKKRPEVKEFFQAESTNKRYIGSSLDKDDSNFAMVQVYENNGVNNATFNWYRVNLITGEVKSEF